MYIEKSSGIFFYGGIFQHDLPYFEISSNFHYFLKTSWFLFLCRFVRSKLVNFLFWLERISQGIKIYIFPILFILKQVSFYNLIIKFSFIKMILNFKKKFAIMFLYIFYTSTTSSFSKACLNSSRFLMNLHQFHQTLPC
jgi:hypothetical protein